MANILVIEDIAEEADFISDGFRADGHSVEIARDGLEGLAMARAGDFDLLIVDRMLPQPGPDGLSLVHTLRKEGDERRMIFVTAITPPPDRIDGLEVGDDYLCKPFAFGELRARVKVLLGRTRMSRDDGDWSPRIIRVADLRIDRLERTVHRGNDLLALQPKQFDLLWALAEGEGEVVTSRQLHERVWNRVVEPESNRLHTHISRLRDKIDKHYEPKLLHTVRGGGYRLGAPD